VVPVGFLAFLYGVSVIVARWQMVVRPTRELLRAEFEAVRARVATLTCPSNGSHACKSQVTALIDRADKCLNVGNGLNWLLAVVFWTQGQEQAGWQLVHEAKEQMAALLPPEELRVEPEDAEVQLRQDAGAAAVALVDQIHAELACKVIDVSDCPAALLREMLAFVTAAASDFAADVAAMLDAKSSAKAADMQALSTRFVLALATGRVVCAHSAGAPNRHAV
jgi:hypothetical protein